MKSRLFYLFSIFFLASGLASQGLALPIGNPAYDLVDRLTIKYGFERVNRPAFNPNLRPMNRSGLVRLLKTYQYQYGREISDTDRFWMQFTFNDNNEWLGLPGLNELENQEDTAQKWLLDSMAVRATRDYDYQRNSRPLFNYFWRTPANFLEVNRPDFFLRLNPILDLRYGLLQDDVEDYIYNRRGVELRGGVDERLFFYFQLVETQRSLPAHLRDFRERFGAVPGAGFVKDYSGLGITDGIDFLNSQGYLSYEISKHVGMRLGYGDNFIGQGERSMLLSDFSNNYPFLQLNWRVWKFHYQNTFAQLSAGEFVRQGPNLPIAKKFMAAHHLSVNIGKRLNLGIFEAVILSRNDGFELAYLNPVIFYRTIEGALGSPDNVLLGVDGSYRLPPSFLFYGQFILDEFKFDELILERNGWWANKWGLQLGLKYIDVLGVDQLDAQVEYNRARPYTYTHNQGVNSYTHFGMPLAHPLGANFSDLMLRLRYRPLPRLQLDGRFYLVDQGEDDPENGLVVGENINVANDDRGMDFGNEIGQGVGYDNTIISGEISYMLRHNLFLEALYYQSSRVYDDPIRENGSATKYISLGLRWNVARRREHF
ncbi:hypothetical protein CEQ90_18075 [Lewinellaceae bacterium SD302]|nr:hypothetical protein CEQ90_18075 [Lewinellaceae bacterium SD302]